jgi:hypothetical protein
VRALASYNSPPHVVVASSSIQEELVGLLEALQLPHTGLQATQPPSYLTAASRLLAHLGWRQVRIRFYIEHHYT